MLSKGRFRYIRSIYRNLESKRRFYELFGMPITVSILDLEDVLERPIEPQPVYPFVQDRSPDIQYLSEFPLLFLPVEKGPESNVTYL